MRSPITWWREWRERGILKKGCDASGVDVVTARQDHTCETVFDICGGGDGGGD